MRTPVPPGTPEDASRRNRRRLIWAAVVVSAVVVGAILAFIVLQPGPPLHLLGVSFSPNPVMPDQSITITAQAQGGSFLAPLSVTAEYESFFAGGGSGGGNLLARGGGSYSGTIGPFSAGTAVWFVVVASDGRAFQLSDSYTVDVGDVPQGGSSGLKLNSILLVPPRPTSLDQPVVTVNVTSAASITEVPFAFTWFYASSGSTSTGGGSGGMLVNVKGNYTSMPLFGFGGGGTSMGTTVGTVWLYRVGAVDSTGNTVLSPTYSFTVASPGG